MAGKSPAFFYLNRLLIQISFIHLSLHLNKTRFISLAMPLTKILIAVKTYPNFSSKNEELASIAGFREDGTWIRIYPIPLKKLSFEKQFKKYDWIEVDVEKNPDDIRTESFHLVNPDNPIKSIGHLDTENNWQERRKHVLKKVYTNFEELLDDAKNKTHPVSLAVFKPKKTVQFGNIRVPGEWDSTKKILLEKYNLYDDYDDEIETIRKLPYKFHFLFEDEKNEQYKMILDDWEAGNLFWNCMKKYENNEARACDYVKRKFFDDYAKSKDVSFFLSTTFNSHKTAKNPFYVAGVFYPKFEHEISFF